MLGVSRIKSPITVATPGINKPLTREELRRAQIDLATLKPVPTPAPARAGTAASTNASQSTVVVRADNPTNVVPAETSTVLTNSAHPAADTRAAGFDDFADLRRQDLIFVVCLSGGGARAARMAAHTLAHLEEEYNQRYPAIAAAHPLSQRIDGWSSISGGSVYASFIAVELQERGCRTNTFDRLAHHSRVRWGTQELGGMTSFFYLWPGNLGYGPLMQLTTEWDTLHMFAHNLALFHEGGVPFFPISRLRELGDLPARPRFFFNGTCRETLRPFIFTQSVLHRDLSGDPLSRLRPDPLQRWIADAPANPADVAQPFGYASTLEDLGSSPQRFPLAYAAMASAAFPGIFNPLSLHRFGFTNAASSVKGAKWWWRQSEVTIVDGGLYDNTGLVTALEWLDYLLNCPGTRPRKVVLLSIDANNQFDGYTGPSPTSHMPWRYDLPFQGALAAVGTMSKMYSAQQSLVLAAINHRIADLQQREPLEFYAIRLLDAARVAPVAENASLLARLRKLEENASKATWSHVQALNLFGMVHDIPTDFVLSDREDADLAFTVRNLLDWSPDPDHPSLSSRVLESVAEVGVDALP